MGERSDFLDPGPLVAEINRWRTEGRMIQDLAVDSGVTDRSIRNYRSGAVGHVRVDCADRLTAAMGIPLAAIYPNLSGGDV